eukprot:evm.model.scf_11.21 EVM.evm.TU.scf_11.21   scf_11:204053-209146(+)
MEGAPNWRNSLRSGGGATQKKVPKGATSARGATKKSSMTEVTGFLPARSEESSNSVDSQLEDQGRRLDEMKSDISRLMEALENMKEDKKSLVATVQANECEISRLKEHMDAQSQLIHVMTQQMRRADQQPRGRDPAQGPDSAAWDIVPESQGVLDGRQSSHLDTLDEQCAITGIHSERVQGLVESTEAVQETVASGNQQPRGRDPAKVPDRADRDIEPDRQGVLDSRKSFHLDILDEQGAINGIKRERMQGLVESAKAVQESVASCNQQPRGRHTVKDADRADRDIVPDGQGVLDSRKSFHLDILDEQGAISAIQRERMQGLVESAKAVQETVACGNQQPRGRDPAKDPDRADRDIVPDRQGVLDSRKSFHLDILDEQGAINGIKRERMQGLVESGKAVQESVASCNQQPRGRHTVKDADRADRDIVPDSQGILGSLQSFHLDILDEQGDINGIKRERMQGLVESAKAVQETVASGNQQPRGRDPAKDPDRADRDIVPDSQGILGSLQSFHLDILDEQGDINGIKRERMQGLVESAKAVQESVASGNQQPRGRHTVKDADRADRDIVPDGQGVLDSRKSFHLDILDEQGAISAIQRERMQGLVESAKAVQETVASGNQQPRGRDPAKDPDRADRDIVPDSQGILGSLQSFHLDILDEQGDINGIKRERMQGLVESAKAVQESVTSGNQQPCGRHTVKDPYRADRDIVPDRQGVLDSRKSFHLDILDEQGAINGIKRERMQGLVESAKAVQESVASCNQQPRGRHTVKDADRADRDIVPDGQGVLDSRKSFHLDILDEQGAISAIQRERMQGLVESAKAVQETVASGNQQPRGRDPAKDPDRADRDIVPDSQGILGSLQSFHLDILDEQGDINGIKRERMQGLVESAKAVQGTVASGNQQPRGRDPAKVPDRADRDIVPDRQGVLDSRKSFHLDILDEQCAINGIERERMQGLVESTEAVQETVASGDKRNDNFERDDRVLKEIVADLIEKSTGASVAQTVLMKLQDAIWILEEKLGPVLELGPSLLQKIGDLDAKVDAKLEREASLRTDLDKILETAQQPTALKELQSTVALQGRRIEQVDKSTLDLFMQLRALSYADEKEKLAVITQMVYGHSGSITDLRRDVMNLRDKLEEGGDDPDQKTALSCESDSSFVKRLVNVEEAVESILMPKMNAHYGLIKGNGDSLKKLDARFRGIKEIVAELGASGAEMSNDISNVMKMLTSGLGELEASAACKDAAVREMEAAVEALSSKVSRLEARASCDRPGIDHLQTVGVAAIPGENCITAHDGGDLSGPPADGKPINASGFSPSDFDLEAGIPRSEVQETSLATPFHLIDAEEGHAIMEEDLSNGGPLDICVVGVEDDCTVQAEEMGNCGWAIQGRWPSLPPIEEGEEGSGSDGDAFCPDAPDAEADGSVDSPISERDDVSVHEVDGDMAFVVV